jgi:hypothetical protein
MGASQSSPVPGGGTEGYHVLRVQDGSPGYNAGLEAFFDFIISLENTRLNQDNECLKDLLKTNKDKPVKMLVYNSKRQSCREVTITPSLNWGGQGLLGVSIRFCSFEGANENVWHILDVEPNSPASLAGLKAFSDYIIGSDTLLHESDDLFALIESSDGRPLKLYLYNSDSDNCREVTITPNSAWGGEGLLGCGIGYGYLHRIPCSAFPSSTDDIPEFKISELQTDSDGCSHSHDGGHGHSHDGGHGHSHGGHGHSHDLPTTDSEQPAVLDGQFTDVSSHHHHHHPNNGSSPGLFVTPASPPSYDATTKFSSTGPVVNISQQLAQLNLNSGSLSFAPPTTINHSLPPSFAPPPPPTSAQAAAASSVFNPLQQQQAHSHPHLPPPPVSLAAAMNVGSMMPPAFKPEPPVPLPTFSHHHHVPPPSLSTMSGNNTISGGGLSSFQQPPLNYFQPGLPGTTTSGGLPAFSTNITLPGMPPLSVNMPPVAVTGTAASAVANPASVPPANASARPKLKKLS